MHPKRIIAAGLLGAMLISSISACGGQENTEPVEQPADQQQVDTGPDSIQESSEATYTNKVVSWKAQSGKKISVGLDSDDSNYIYLNIHCEDASDGDEIGYYLKEGRGKLEYSDENNILTDCDSGTNVDHANFFIPRQLYDAVAAMEYVDDTNYGVRWSDDGSDGTTDGTMITVRAVNLKTAALIGIFDIVIDHNEKKNSYAITSVNSADVREYGLLDEEEREKAVKDAVDFAATTVFPNIGETRWQTAARNGAIVHKSGRTYFSRFINTEKKSDKYARHLSCADTFAVTMPVDYYGYATIYMAPKTECMGLTEAKMYDSDSYDLQVYGYDPINPRDEMSIVVPIDFFAQ